MSTVIEAILGLGRGAPSFATTPQPKSQLNTKNLAHHRQSQLQLITRPSNHGNTKKPQLSLRSLPFSLQILSGVNGPTKRLHCQERADIKVDGELLIIP
jgi:hypothetical protein